MYGKLWVLVKENCTPFCTCLYPEQDPRYYDYQNKVTTSCFTQNSSWEKPWSPTIPNFPNRPVGGGCNYCKWGWRSTPMADGKYSNNVFLKEDNCSSAFAVQPCKCTHPMEYYYSIGKGYIMWEQRTVTLNPANFPDESIPCNAGDNYNQGPGLICKKNDIEQQCTWQWYSTKYPPNDIFDLYLGDWFKISGSCGFGCACPKPKGVGRSQYEEITNYCVKDINDKTTQGNPRQDLNNIQNQRTFMVPNPNGSTTVTIDSLIDKSNPDNLRTIDVNFDDLNY
jgi:hypothetical protein